jgi:hypothetical protein
MYNLKPMNIALEARYRKKFEDWEINGSGRREFTGHVPYRLTTSSLMHLMVTSWDSISLMW